MNERRRISVNGLISVTVAIDGQGRVRGEPAVSIQGIPVEEDRADFIADASDAAAAAATDGPKDEAKLREAIRLAVRRQATKWTGKKPIVDVSLIRI
jgi:ribonuclease J